MARNRYHENLMATYYAAREAWKLQAEYVTCGYRTEMAEYRQRHPQPTFKEFLRGGSMIHTSDSAGGVAETLQRYGYSLTDDSHILHPDGSTSSVKVSVTKAGRVRLTFPHASSVAGKLLWSGPADKLPVFLERFWGARPVA